MKNKLSMFRFLTVVILGFALLSLSKPLKANRPLKPLVDTGSIYIQLSNLTSCPLAIYLKIGDVIIGSFSLDANQTALRSFSKIPNFSKSAFNVSVVTTNRNTCGEKQKFNAVMGPPIDVIGWGYPFSRENTLPSWQLQLFAHVYPDAVGPFGMYVNSVDFTIPPK